MVPFRKEGLLSTVMVSCFLRSKSIQKIEVVSKMPGTSDESIFLRIISLIQLLVIDSFGRAASVDRIIEI